MEALDKQRWEDYKDIETKEQGLSKSPRNKQGLNITETVEKVNQQRMQNLMDIEAKELVGFFKVYKSYLTVDFYSILCSRIPFS